MEILGNKLLLKNPRHSMNNQLLDTRKSLIHQSLKSKKGKNLIEIHTNRGGKSNQNRRQNGDGQRGELGKEGDSLG